MSATKGRQAIVLPSTCTANLSVQGAMQHTRYTWCYKCMAQHSVHVNVCHSQRLDTDTEVIAEYYNCGQVYSITMLLQRNK